MRIFGGEAIHSRSAVPSVGPRGYEGGRLTDVHGRVVNELLA
jgi:hypothetical protein